MHGAVGVCTEAGELQDMLKKHLIYGKALDITNVIEECGDILWYVALALGAIDTTLEECMERNINKLRIRFPGKFSNERALNRDSGFEPYWDMWAQQELDYLQRDPVWESATIIQPGPTG